MEAPSSSPKITSWGGNELTPRYLEYISSQAWTIRKHVYFSKHPRKCSACGKDQKVNLHHIRYDNLAHEPDEDFVPLCETCHKTVHAIHQLSKERLDVVTNRWVTRNRNRRPKKSPSYPIFLSRRSSVDQIRARHEAKKQKKAARRSRVDEILSRTSALNAIAPRLRTQPSDLFAAMDEKRKIARTRTQGNR